MKGTTEETAETVEVPRASPRTRPVSAWRLVPAKGQAVEAEYLPGMLDKHLGNFSRAAAAGLDRTYFKRLLQKYER